MLNKGCSLLLITVLITQHPHSNPDFRISLEINPFNYIEFSLSLIVLLASDDKQCIPQTQFQPECSWSSLGMVVHIYMWQKLNLKIPQTT